MEDEEYEDVLVISYTDHGSSILPQSTAEKIMKNIRLEVTQKVTHNSNEKSLKLGQSEENLLDQFVNNRKSELMFQTIGFLAYERSRDTFYIGHGPKIDALSHKSENCYKHSMTSTYCDVGYVLPWKDYT